MAKEMRKVRTGTVVRTKMNKTAVVQLVWKQRDRLYHKQVRRVARFNVHDHLSQCQLGDVVRIQEVRPISKTKRWRLMEILERRQVAEVRPIELESDAQVLVSDELAADDFDQEYDALLAAEGEEEEPEDGNLDEGLAPEEED